MDVLHETLMGLITNCKDERDVDKRAEILNEINHKLQPPYKIRIPSLITNDYISLALYRIEEGIQVPA